MYPTTRREEIVDDLHGTPVPDPYRWLEDPDSPDTKGWLVGQEELFRKQAGPQRFKERIAELLRSGSVGVPVWRGERNFFSRRTPTRSTRSTT